MSMDNNIPTTVTYPTGEENCAACLSARQKTFCVMKHNSGLCLDKLSSYIQLQCNPKKYGEYENIVVRYAISHVASGNLVHAFDVEIFVVNSTDTNVQHVCLKKFEIDFSNFTKDISPTCVPYLLHTAFEKINHLFSNYNYALTSYVHQVSTEYVFTFQRK